ncbi:acyl-CoA synthetase [Campylobacter sp. FMV-PI01]|uniref:Acyl-CoA synthetase n=1 Tax=Campylobacter portucalensis TaxID=2608384 RepID=A0A6L5WM03_9BACT|nr:AMP-binding protein [Campylobacter portucalensis]MSN96711.1 acyl-CoA synthetase [Campylobacter portucalensis]
MINKNIFFIQEEKNYSDFEKQALEFSEFLNINNIKELSLNLDNIYNFFVCFFGCMHANVKSYLNNNISFVVDDKNLKTMKASCGQNSLNFNENYEFYLKTSGSSGEPKLIKKSIKQMLLEAVCLQEFLNLKNPTFFSSVSHLNMFGLTFKVFLPLISGGKIHSFLLNYPEIMQDIDFSNGVFITSPTVLNILSQKSELKNLKDLICSITAGSKLKDSVMLNLKTIFNMNVIEIYGSTETGVIARNLDNQFYAFKGVDLKISQDDRLLINSPWCDNFLSSDMANLDGDKITLLGRYDRIVKLNDMRFSLDGAENLLKTHDFVNDAKCELLEGNNRISALISLSDKGKIAYLKGGKKRVSNELKSYTKDKFKTNIRYFKITSKIALNSNGKFTKKDFLNEYNKVKKPELKEIEQDGLFEIFTSEDLFFYEGHFNTFPITPGFIELGFVYEALRMKKIDILKIKSIENIKFTAILRPMQKVFLSLKDGENLVNFEIFDDEKIYASGRMRFG